MPRIRLAFWHNGHVPGDEVDVDDETLRALQRDGRVAEVLSGDPGFAGGVLPAAMAEVTNEAGAAEEVVPAPRRRRAAQEE